MMKSTLCSFALISSLVGTAISSVVPRQSCGSSGPTITADGTGVSGMEIGNSNPIAASGAGTVILTTTGYQSWEFDYGGLGWPSCSTSRFMNIGSSTHPWKPLTWASSQSTTTWEASYGSYLTAGATSSYSETSDFMACESTNPSTSIGAPSVQWPVFLLTSSSLPTVSDDTLANVDITTCVKTKLFIGYDDSEGGWKA